MTIDQLAADAAADDAAYAGVTRVTSTTVTKSGTAIISVRREETIELFQGSDGVWSVKPS